MVLYVGKARDMADFLQKLDQIDGTVAEVLERMK